MAKKTKLRLKRSVLYKLSIVLIVLFIGSVYGKQRYDEYNYKQTMEYKLIQKGWSKSQIKDLEKLYKGHMNDILKMRANDNIIKFAKEKYFLYKNLNAYLDYAKNNEDVSLTDVVAIINTHANNEWYTYDLDTDVSLEEKLIVNKFYHLNEDYNPEDIVEISSKYAYDDNHMRQSAYDAFKNMWSAAMDNNIQFIINSSYRDFNSQKEIYEDYKSWYGEDKADSQAARPGYSEHQTGYAIDLFAKDNQLSDTFEESEGYKWLQNNAYKYGFIERYPKDKQYLTGYAFESWHWRYVGVEAATVIHNEGITYDEYYAYYIEK